MNYFILLNAQVDLKPFSHVTVWAPTKTFITSSQLPTLLLLTLPHHTFGGFRCKGPLNHNIRFQKYKLKMLFHPPPPVGGDQLWFVKQQVELSASFWFHLPGGVNVPKVNENVDTYIHPVSAIHRQGFYQRQESLRVLVEVSWWFTDVFTPHFLSTAPSSPGASSVSHVPPP